MNVGGRGYPPTAVTGDGYPPVRVGLDGARVATAGVKAGGRLVWVGGGGCVGTMVAGAIWLRGGAVAIGTTVAVAAIGGTSVGVGAAEAASGPSGEAVGGGGAFASRTAVAAGLGRGGKGVLGGVVRAVNRPACGDAIDPWRSGIVAVALGSSKTMVATRNSGAAVGVGGANPAGVQPTRTTNIKRIAAGPTKRS